MSAIDEYRKHKEAMRHAEHWAALIGRRYHCGGGGIGEVKSVEVDATVYHQEYDGATNYHAVPQGLRLALQSRIKAAFRDLLREALSDMEEERIKLAEAAHAEHAKLMAEAGLSEQPA